MQRDDRLAFFQRVTADADQSAITPAHKHSPDADLSALRELCFRTGRPCMADYSSHNVKAFPTTLVFAQHATRHVNVARNQTDNYCSCFSAICRRISANGRRSMQRSGSSIMTLCTTPSPPSVTYDTHFTLCNGSRINSRIIRRSLQAPRRHWSRLTRTCDGHCPITPSLTMPPSPSARLWTPSAPTTNCIVSADRCFCTCATATATLDRENTTFRAVSMDPRWALMRTGKSLSASYSCMPLLILGSGTSRA